MATLDERVDAVALGQQLLALVAQRVADHAGPGGEARAQRARLQGDARQRSTK